MHIETNVYLTEGQKNKLRKAVQKQEECVLRIKQNEKPNAKLKLTQTQVNKMNRGEQIKLSKAQMKQNGGFIGALLPIIAKGALAGLASLGAQKAANKILGRGVLQNWEGGSLINELLPYIAKGAVAGLAAIGAHRTVKKVLTGKGKKKRGKGVHQNWEI